MSFKIALVGKPNAGKSSLFSALTQREVLISERPFTTISPNKGVVFLPDKRLDQIVTYEKIPQKRYGFLELIDVAGLIEKAHQGQGLGIEFLSHLQEADLLVFVLRNFVLSGALPEPAKDLETVTQEIILRDLIVLERNEKKIKDKEGFLSLKEKLQRALEDIKPFFFWKAEKEEERIVKEFGILSFKKKLILLNGFYSQPNLGLPYLQLDAKIELELAKASEEESETLRGLSSLENFWKTCYDKLGLLTFFTIAHKKEGRANLVEKGTTIKEASFLIHTEIGENLKGAERINWEKYKEIRSWEEAKRQGAIERVSAQAEVREGDIIEFKV